MLAFSIIALCISAVLFIVAVAAVVAAVFDNHMDGPVVFTFSVAALLVGVLVAYSICGVVAAS